MPLQANLSFEKKVQAHSSKHVSYLSRVAPLVATGLILFLFESSIPRPLPWLKPGFSNLVTILALYLYGIRTAILVVLLRVMIAALILGTLFNPAFLFALCGGLGSTLVMFLLYKYMKNIFSVIGVSLSGAFAHNLIQILLAAFLVINTTQVLYLLPIMLLSSLFSGFLVGVFAHYTLLRMRHLELI